MNLKLKLLACAFCVSFASPALAQGGPAVFSGLKVEGLVGYDRSAIGVDDEVFGEEANESRNGVLYGIGLGFDVRQGNVVYGLEGEYTDSTTGADYTADEVDVNGSIVSGTAELDASRDLYIGVRAGTLVTPGTLLYIKGGYSRASATLDALGDIDGEPNSLEADASFDGLRVGAGAETVLSYNTFAKLEYRYSNYSGGNIEVDGEEMEIDEAFDSIDIDRHQVVVGFGVRF